MKKLRDLIDKLKHIQAEFYKIYGVNDIISNSKIFEVLIADSLGHTLIPGHSGSRDGKDCAGGEYEYKHYKELSSNHTWTFNDFTDATITKLNSVKAVIFAHVQDIHLSSPRFDWYYLVPGNQISNFLKIKTKKIKNRRKMINISPKQIEKELGISKTFISRSKKKGQYTGWINKIFDIAKEIEKITGTEGVLTSNKLWEIIVALELDHMVLSEQAGHDAKDKQGNFYEYKVAINYSWNFQDISEEVLKKYINDRRIILATVDKDNFKVKEIYAADPIRTVKILRKKLREKRSRFRKKGEKIRRLQVSLSKGDLRKIKARIIYPPS